MPVQLLSTISGFTNSMINRDLNYIYDIALRLLKKLDEVEDIVPINPVINIIRSTTKETYVTFSFNDSVKSLTIEAYELKDDLKTICHIVEVDRASVLDRIDCIIIPEVYESSLFRIMCVTADGRESDWSDAVHYSPTTGFSVNDTFIDLELSTLKLNKVNSCLDRCVNLLSNNVFDDASQHGILRELLNIRRHTIVI